MAIVHLCTCNEGSDASSSNTSKVHSTKHCQTARLLALQQRVTCSNKYSKTQPNQPNSVNAGRCDKSLSPSYLQIAHRSAHPPRSAIPASSLLIPDPSYHVGLFFTSSLLWPKLRKPNQSLTPSPKLPRPRKSHPSQKTHQTRCLRPQRRLRPPRLEVMVERRRKVRCLLDNPYSH